MYKLNKMLSAKIFAYALISVLLIPVQSNSQEISANIMSCHFNIGDFVWYDSDADGIQDAGEVGIPNVLVLLYRANGTYLTQTATNQDGWYNFIAGSYGYGDYKVKFILPSGYIFSPKDQGGYEVDSDADESTGFTDAFSCNNDGDYYTVDAGMYQFATIGDFVWNDLDEDGIQDGNESGISGVEVKLYKSDGTFVNSTNTNQAGYYQFTNIPEGNYYIKFVLESGYAFSPKDQGSNDEVDSDANTTTGITATTYLSAWETDPTWDAGMHVDSTPQVASVGDFVWYDGNEDGKQNTDGSSVGVSNVTVQLFESGGTPAGSTTTNSSGYYLFDNLTPGNYYLKFSNIPTGYVFTHKDQGTDDTIDSDVNPANGQSDVFNLSAGENDMTWDAGIFEAPITHPNCDFLYSVADDGDKLVYLPKDGSAGATSIGSLGVTSVEAITISLDESTLYAAHLGTFGKINWNTGAFSSIGSFGTAGGSDGGITLNDVDGLAFDPSTGDLYGTHRRGDGSPEDLLFMINPTTGQHVPNAFGSGIDYVKIRTYSAVGLYDVDDIAVDPADGQMYAVVNSSGGNDRIVKVDKATGIVTDIGRLHTSSGNLNDMEGLSFHNDGNFYGTTGSNGDSSTNNTTWIINTSTALVTKVHSMGLYGDYEAIAGCIDYTPITSIGDFVWYDGDENGMQNTDGSSVGVPNVTVQLFHGNGNSAGTTTTNSQGYYQFTNLTPGDYYLKFSNLPSGYVFTNKDQGTDDTIDSDVNPSNGQTDVTNLSAGEHDMSWDAGIIETTIIIPPSDPTCDEGTSLLWENNVVINDCNVSFDVRLVNNQTTTYTIPGPYPSAFDGSVDVTISEAVAWDGYCDRPGTGEQPNERFRVIFKKNGNVVWSSPYTGGTTDGIDTGVISDEWVGPLGTTVNLPNGADEILLVHWSNDTYGEGDHSNANSVVPSSVCINYETVTPQLGSIGNWVWHDTFHSTTHQVDGIQDADELGIEGVLVELLQGGSVIDTETTNANGFYEFTNLPAGDYIVRIASSNFATNAVLDDWYAAPQNQGGNDALDSDGDGTETAPFQQSVNLSAGENDLTNDFGFFYTCVNLTKTGPSSVNAGETITYKFRYENCGDIVHHTGAHVYDPLINPDGDHEIWSDIVWPGEVKEFTRTYTTTKDDCEELQNCAWAIGSTPKPSGYSPDLPDDRDDDCWTVIVNCDDSCGGDCNYEYAFDWKNCNTGNGNVWEITNGQASVVRNYTMGGALGNVNTTVTLNNPYGKNIDLSNRGVGPPYVYTGTCGQRSDQFTYGSDYLTFGITADNSNQYTSFTFDFDKPLYICEMEISDIDWQGDYWGGNYGWVGYQDEVDITANYNGTPVSVYATIPGSRVNVSGNHTPNLKLLSDYNTYQDGDISPDDARGMVFVSTSSPVTSITIKYSNGPDDGGKSNDQAIRISGLSTCVEPIGSIGDYVWWDENHNGLQDDDALFPGNAPHGINDVRVILWDNSGPTPVYLDEMLTTNNPSTGGPGWYLFDNLPAGEYLVTVDRATVPADLIYQTYDYDGINTQDEAEVTLGTGEQNLNLDFGYDDEPLPVTLSSFVANSGNGEVTLTWVTESEIENQGFIIERRLKDGNDWNEISSFTTNAELKGQGTVTYSTTYDYVDRLVQVGQMYEYRLGDVDYNGVVEYHATREVMVDEASAQVAAPNKFAVKPAYPNPFNPSTVIEYAIPDDGMVNITIYDLMGQKISTLRNEMQKAGWHQVRWGGQDDHGISMPAGVYLISVNAGNSIKTMKLIFVK